MKSFGGSETIFADMDVVNPNKDYTPSELPEREQELDALHSTLRPVTMGSTPLNAFVYGHPGQGKTDAIKIKTAQLEEYAEEHGPDLTIVNVKCKGLDKSYHVMAHLVKELRGGPGEELPKGYQKKELFEIIESELRDIGGTVIIILDEIDSIGEDDYILYELPRLSLENVRLSIIGITNDFQFRDNLDADVRSSLGEDEIKFAPYDASQLRAILARRAAKGLRDTEFVITGQVGDRPIAMGDDSEDGEVLVSDVLDPGVIPLVAGISATDTGDARQALRLFFRSCRLADDNGEDTVLETHVRDARAFIQQHAVEDGIETLPVQSKIALMTVTRLALEGETPAETVNLYDYYKRICRLIDVEVLSDRRFREKLNDLAKLNIVRKKTTGRGQGCGVTNKYSLAVDASTVIDSLWTGEDGRFADVLRKLESLS